LKKLGASCAIANFGQIRNANRSVGLVISVIVAEPVTIQGKTGCYAAGRRSGSYSFGRLALMGAGWTCVVLSGDGSCDKG
jgi:hypothetical protein